MSNKQKIQNPKFELPKHIAPTLFLTACHKYAFYEEGGKHIIKNIERKYAKILCSQEGLPRRAVYYFKPRSFEHKSNHSKSLVLYAKKHDYIISVSERTITPDAPGLFTLAIYQITAKHTKNITDKPLYLAKGQVELRVKLHLSMTISFRYNKESDYDIIAYDTVNKEHVFSLKLNDYLTDKIHHFIETHNVTFLQNAITAALQKMSNETTSYSYIAHRSKKTAREENL